VGPAKGGRNRDDAPWRHGDRLARQRERSRAQLAAAALVTVAVLSASSRALTGYFERLQGDLATERSRITALSDSVAAFRVALRGRTEQVVMLERATGPVRLPVAGRVASGFTAQRLHPILRLWRAHEGVDIPAGAGTPIRPVAPGRIVRVGRDLGWGLVVEIDHGRVTTRYAHLSRTVRRAGEWIEAGEVIGLVGETGLATSPHLHYEVLRGNTPINPLAYALRVIELVPTTTRRVADTKDEALDPPPPQRRTRPTLLPGTAVISTSSSSPEL
jgi:murein DD-endopeptidase MepM/ murein hydrolase activator NlpD